MTNNTLSFLIEQAQRIGFLAMGFSRPGRPLYFEHFLSWINELKYAEMNWIKRHIDIRADQNLLLPGCKISISLAFPYPNMKPSTPDGLSIARYADPQNDDYHDRIKKACRSLIDLITSEFPGSHSRIYVDSAPLLERDAALKAGLGFIGKNNMLILPDYGSYFYLAEILSTAPLQFEPIEPIKNLCGSCVRCLEACPAGALEKPYLLNAAKCYSYLTIEHSGYLSPEHGRKMGNCFLGCDRCQEACPFNRPEKTGEPVLPATQTFMEMDQETFTKHYGRTALARAGLTRIKRNIGALKG